MKPLDLILQQGNAHLLTEENRRSFGPTLRDQFAMAALTGLLSVLANVDYNERPSISELTKHTYRYADAMLAAREK